MYSYLEIILCLPIQQSFAYGFTGSDEVRTLTRGSWLTEPEPEPFGAGSVQNSH